MFLQEQLPAGAKKCERIKKIIPVTKTDMRKALSGQLAGKDLNPLNNVRHAAE